MSTQTQTTYLRIGDDVSSLKIYEIINKYFGRDYTGWMKAWYDINDEYAAWFPTITKTDDMPTGNFGGTKSHSNTISSDGKVITEINHTVKTSSNDIGDEKYSKRRLVFARINRKLTFVGIFERHQVKEAEYLTYKHERIATEIKMIGSPVYELVIPGESEKLEEVGINIPLRPKKVVIGVDGIDRIICGNCDYEFMKAPRCPECGQLINYENEKWNKPQLANLDEWERVSAITGASTKEIADIVREIINDDGFSYHVGSVDLMVDLSVGTNGKSGNVLKLFGNHESGGFQPKSLTDFLMQNNIDIQIAYWFMKEMKPFLSSNQKNVPYERLEGYYYIDYSTMVARKSELKKVLIELRDKVKNTNVRG